MIWIVGLPKSYFIYQKLIRKEDPGPSAGIFLSSVFNRLDHQSSLLNADHGRGVGAESSLFQPVTVQVQTGLAGIVRSPLGACSLIALGKWKTGSKTAYRGTGAFPSKYSGESTSNLLSVLEKLCTGC